MLTRIVLLILVVGVLSHLPHLNRQQVSAKIAQTKIMYGSTIRIKATGSNYHLHSHEVKYPRGSGYQSVTGMVYDNDYNSLWTIREAHNEQIRTYNEPVRCGDTVRLEHVLTKHNLHSESLFMSMITEAQEVSAFGSDGLGDESTFQSNGDDNWIISCHDQANESPFLGGYTFDLIHENTEKHLKMSRFHKYAHSNWENCPCDGQLEISAVASANKQTSLQIVGGVFYQEEEPEKHDSEKKEGEQL